MKSRIKPCYHGMDNLTLLIERLFIFNILMNCEIIVIPLHVQKLFSRYHASLSQMNVGQYLTSLIHHDSKCFFFSKYTVFCRVL